MKTEVNINDLYRILSMVPVAPSGMSPEEFTAFVGLCGAVNVGEKAAKSILAKLIIGLRVTPGYFDSPNVGTKISTIKEIRNLTGTALKEAKDCTEGMWLKVALSGEAFEKLKIVTPGVPYDVEYAT